jgi:phosphocarrier protein FPr/phosphocarrier protein
VDDARVAARNGAEGCGLLRTEFLFLNRRDPPSEGEQVASYASVADAFADRPLIIRTLDAGSDKPLPYLPMAPEENPALGTRGIRLLLTHPDLLEQQFVAILKAVPTARCRIMLPMLADLAELRAARALLRAAERRLAIAESVELGIMVETPAAALLAERLAREADFLSVGSNDLTQYALAADRQNPAVAPSADSLHPAVLRLIAMAAEGAHAHRRWLGVCGSIASDPAAAAILIGLGVDELSVSPPMVPAIKARVRMLDSAGCRRLAESALQAANAADVRKLIEETQDAPAL